MELGQQFLNEPDCFEPESIEPRPIWDFTHFELTDRGGVEYPTGANKMVACQLRIAHRPKFFASSSKRSASIP